MTGQTGTKRALLCAVAVAAAGAGLSGCSVSSSDAVTTLYGATGVTVSSPGHPAVPAVNDQRLLVGDTITTTTDPTVLDTGKRLTTIAAGSSLTIAARSDYLLNAGTAVVNRHVGQDVTLIAGAVTVSDIGRTSVRVDRAFSVRVAVYDGGGADVWAGSRELIVPALHQLQVPGASLPTTVAPLALLDDASDVAADAPLVADDQALNARAAGLDTPSAAMVGAVLVDEVPTILPVARGVAADASLPLSERVLAIAIAHSSEMAPSQAFSQVEQLRNDGGAWAVIASLTRANMAKVETAISMLTDGTAAANSSVEAAGGADGSGAGDAPDGVEPTAGASTGSAGSSTSGQIGSDGASRAPGGSGGAGTEILSTTTTVTTTTTTTTPTPVSTVIAVPTPTPVPTVASGLVTTLLTTVGGLLAPTAAPSASSSAGDLLGGLL